MPVIYVDVLVALNWLIDALLLYATARLLRTPLGRFRMVLGSLFGGIYACRLLLPTLPFLVRLLVDVAAASIMLLLAFGKCRLYTFVKRLTLFMITSMLFSGVTSLLSGERLLVHNGVVYADISPLLLTVFTVAAYGVVRVWEWAMTRRLPKGGECRLSVCDNGGESRVRAMWDSGMHLREPFSGAPVVLIQRRSMENSLPKELQEALAGTTTTTRLRMIPYRTVGGEGMLPAFRPRSVTVQRLGEKDRDISGVYVALCDDLGRGEYEALIGNDCWEGWER